MSAANRDDLIRLLEPAIEAMGYELADLEMHLGGPGSVLRVFIDSQDGVNVDDCAAVSHQVSGLLDVDDPIPGEYSLEVSSPGLDRRLTKPEHFDRFAGSRVKVRLNSKIDGRRRFKGRLMKRDGKLIVVREGKHNHPLRIEDIEVARLVPEI